MYVFDMNFVSVIIWTYLKYQLSICFRYIVLQQNIIVGYIHIVFMYKVIISICLLIWNLFIFYHNLFLGMCKFFVFDIIFSEVEKTIAPLLQFDISSLSFRNLESHYMFLCFFHHTSGGLLFSLYYYYLLILLIQILRITRIVIDVYIFIISYVFFG